MCVCVLSHVQLFATPWPIAGQVFLIWKMGIKVNSHLNICSGYQLLHDRLCQYRGVSFNLLWINRTNRICICGERKVSCEGLTHAITEAKKSYSLLPGSCIRKANGIIQSESIGLGTRNTRVQGREKMDVTAQAERTNSPFLCLFIAFEPSTD